MIQRRAQALTGQATAKRRRFTSFNAQQAWRPRCVLSRFAASRVFRGMVGEEDGTPRYTRQLLAGHVIHGIYGALVAGGYVDGGEGETKRHAAGLVRYVNG